MRHGLKQIGRRWVALSGAAFAVLAIPALAQSDGLGMLDRLTKGEWTITFRDGTPARKLCVRNGRELIQIRHIGQDCNKFVVQDEATRIGVQYKCAGNDYARTDLRRENSSLVQIYSRGSKSGTDFAFNAEARRTGICR